MKIVIICITVIITFICIYVEFIPRKIISIARIIIFCSLLVVIITLLSGSTFMLAFTWTTIAFVPLIMLTIGHASWRRLCPFAFVAMIPFKKGKVLSANHFLVKYPLLPLLLLSLALPYALHLLVMIHCILGYF